jgi:hypothetical protein
MEKENVSDHGKYLGKKGGEARAASLSPQRRSEIAKIAANKRWNKQQEFNMPYKLDTDKQVFLIPYP